MYRALVDQYGTNSRFSFISEEERYTADKTDVWVLLPRGMSYDRRRALPRLQQALTEVRNEAMKTINDAALWSSANSRLLSKATKAKSLIHEVTNFDGWSMGYGDERVVRREFIDVLMATVPTSVRDTAVKAAENKVWDQLGGRLDPDEEATLATRVTADTYEGDDEWAKRCADLPEMIW